MTWATMLLVCSAFLHFADSVYPLRDWLFLTLVRIWAWHALLASACATFGAFVVQRVLRVRPRSALQHLALSTTMGGLAFAMGMFAAGTIGWFHPAWAVAWPLTLLVGGVLGTRGRPGWASVLRPAVPAHAPDLVRVWATRATTAFGCLSLALLMLALLTPESVSYDAAWTHLTIAQDYAREGRIVPFRADWPKNLAHLGSVINTWAFLVPGLGPAPQVRWLFALHTEFTYLLFTLVGVAAAVERVVERPVHGAWVSLFLFPGLFVYDGNLGGGSDHFAAFFCPMAFLAAVEAAHTLDHRWWATLGLLAGGAVVTKYQSVYYLAAVGVIPAAAWLRATTRDQRAATLTLPLVAALAAFIVAAPHFVRNWIFYDNPVYPFGQRWFSASAPRIPDAAAMADNIIAHFGSRAPQDWPTRLAEAIALTFTFPFRTHAGYTGKVPVFGTIFVLCLPLVSVLRRGARPWAAIVSALLSVFFWAWTYRVDRNLQTLAPLLAIATAAIIARCWEAGGASRAAISILIGLQLVWGGDHMLLDTNRLSSALALIRSGYDGRARTRFDEAGKDRVDVGRALPLNARVLLHNEHVNLGIDRTILLDWLGMQGLIDMRTIRTPRALYQRYRQLGVTHVVFHPGYHPAPTKQEEVVFAAFADRYRDQTRTFGALRLLELPSDPPPDESPYQVLVLGVGGYADGVYPVEQLATMTEMPPELQVRGVPAVAANVETARLHLPDVQAVLLGERARSLADHADLQDRFRKATEYVGLFVWLKAP